MSKRVYFPIKWWNSRGFGKYIQFCDHLCVVGGEEKSTLAVGQFGNPFHSQLPTWPVRQNFENFLMFFSLIFCCFSCSVILCLLLILAILTFQDVELDSYQPPLLLPPSWRNLCTYFNLVLYTMYTRILVYAYSRILIFSYSRTPEEPKFWEPSVSRNTRIKSPKKCGISEWLKMVKGGIKV